MSVTDQNSTPKATPISTASRTPARAVRATRPRRPSLPRRPPSVIRASYSATVSERQVEHDLNAMLRGLLGASVIHTPVGTDDPLWQWDRRISSLWALSKIGPGAPASRLAAQREAPRVQH